MGAIEHRARAALEAQIKELREMLNWIPESPEKEQILRNLERMMEIVEKRLGPGKG